MDKNLFSKILTAAAQAGKNEGAVELCDRVIQIMQASKVEFAKQKIPVTAEEMKLAQDSLSEWHYIDQIPPPMMENILVMNGIGNIFVGHVKEDDNWMFGGVDDHYKNPIVGVKMWCHLPRVVIGVKDEG